MKRLGRWLSILSLLILFICSCQKDDAKISQPTAKKTSSPSKPVNETNSNSRAQFAGKLWKTSLGRQYQAFLFAKYDREEFPERAKRLSEKIFSDSNQIVAKVTALQMMNKDLYVSKKIDDDVLARIALLEHEMEQDRRELQKSTVKSIMEQIPFVFLATLPMGSPLVQSELKNTFGQMGRWIVARIRGRQAPPLYDVQWRRMASREVLEDYQFGKALDAFSKTAIPLALVEWVYVEQKIDDSGESLSQDELTRGADF